MSCTPVSLVVSSQPFELDHPGLNPARFTAFNRVITVGRLLPYNFLALQLHSSVAKHDEWKKARNNYEVTIRITKIF